jgi:formate dehydrogenase maturation protein FdhE
VKSPAAKRASAVGSEFERRAARAEALARDSPAAAEPLRFAAGLYRAQGRVAAELDAAHSEDPFTGHADRDADRIREKAEPVVRFAADSGPERLSGEARARLEDSAATARTRLLVYWSGDRGAGEDYLSRAILRPYVELLRALNRPPDRIHRNGRCPFCGGGPWVAARREGSLMEGARRQLACALCGVEWPFGRILCPSCLEQDPVKLPSFTSQTHPTVRIEACETCRRYVKSLDLSEDARPIPEVDDLVSLSMDLWAREQGYERIEPGIAGL